MNRPRKQSRLQTIFQDMKTMPKFVKYASPTMLAGMLIAGALIAPILIAQEPAAPVGPSTAIQRRAAPPARINDFRVVPDSIQPGQTVTLFWAVENPQGITIDPGIGIVVPRGSRRLTPAATTTYTLTTKGFNGVVTKEVTVTVAGTKPISASAAAPETPKKEWRLANGKPD